MEQGYISYIRGMVGTKEVIMLAAGALIFNRQGHLLLQQRTDTHVWDHPGGFKELGETIEETARREIYEETSLQLRDMNLFGVYSYQTQAPNGDKIDLVKLLFSCQDYTGNLSCRDGESAQLAFFPLTELPSPLTAHMTQILQDLNSQASPPFVH